MKLASTKKQAAKKTTRARILKHTFEGLLRPPGFENPSWTLEAVHDVRKLTRDEDWFAWAEGRKIRITVEMLS